MNQAVILNILMDSMIHNHRLTTPEHILRRIFGYKPNLPGRPSTQTAVPGIYINDSCYYGIINNTYLIKIHTNIHRLLNDDDFRMQAIDTIRILYTNIHTSKQYFDTIECNVMLTSDDVIPERFKSTSGTFQPFIIEPARFGNDIHWCPILTDAHYERLKNHITMCISSFMADTIQIPDNTLVIF